MKFGENLVRFFLKNGTIAKVLNRLIDKKIKDEKLNRIVKFLVSPSDKIVLALFDDNKNDEAQIKAIVIEHFNKDEAIEIITDIAGMD